MSSNIQWPQVPFIDPITKDISLEWKMWLLNPQFLTISLGGVVAVTNGGTGLAAGTSGGILGFVTSTTLQSSGLLTAHALVLGGGAGATPSTLASLGTTSTVLHGNAAGAPTFGKVALASDVSGTLPTGSGGTGVTGASLGSASGVVLGDSGTFTPIVVGSTLAGAGTYSVQQGNYTRVGDRLLFNLFVTWSATTGTGNLLIGGLPFSSNAGTNTHSVFQIDTNFAIALQSSYIAQLPPGSTNISILSTVVGGAPAALAIQASGSVNISGAYLL